MDPAGGYVRLYRRLLQNPIWTQLAPAVLKVAIYFLLRANYKPAQWYDGRESVGIPAGSFITSYASAAEACAISMQQVRDAFFHLSRTQFATYQRTHRWTLVTVLNWADYQASQNDAEHGEEHRGEQAKNTAENRQRTPDKEIKNLRSNTPLPPEGVNGVDTFSRNGPIKSGKRGQADDPVVSQVATSIHGRHPEVHRDCGVAAIQKSLEAIIRHREIPKHERGPYLERLDRNHAAWCLTEQWQKDGGQYAKGLEKWLAPTKWRYEADPPISGNASASLYTPAEDE